ncbi:MAG: hypothetical protein ABEK59_10270 [Halobacteria archaeon]
MPYINPEHDLETCREHAPKRAEELTEIIPYPLDHTPETLPYLDKAFSRDGYLRENYSEDFLLAHGHFFISYLGEMVKTELDGEWTWDDEYGWTIAVENNGEKEIINIPYAIMIAGFDVDEKDVSFPDIYNRIINKYQSTTPTQIGDLG